jgi:O-acetyl-ADP-ribose deacetylase
MTLKITIKKGSITNERVDAIVIPANSTGSMPGGVALVIKTVGGEEIEEEAIAQAPIPIGEAVATGAGNLLARILIHAPIMEYPGGKTDEHCIQCAMESSLTLADANNAETIAFPGMGTGTGGISPASSAKVMIATLKKHDARTIREVFLVDISDEVVKAWNSALKKANI